jgi:hypothetical protein
MYRYTIYIVLVISLVANIYLGVNLKKEMRDNVKIKNNKNVLLTEDINILSRLLLESDYKYNEFINFLDSNNVEYFVYLKRGSSFFSIELNDLIFEFNDSGMIDYIFFKMDTLTRPPSRSSESETASDE